MNRLLLCLIISLTSTCVVAQQKKVEVEKKIKPKDAPTSMMETLDSFLKNARKVKIYQELNEHGTSYECKFILNKIHYSIEFSEAGKLEDVEVIQCFTELPKMLQDRIASYLMSNDNFKITKLQKQFSSQRLNDEEVINSALKNIATDTLRYELIVKVKSQNEWKTFEMLFSDTGNFIKKIEIDERTEDHLLY